MSADLNWILHQNAEVQITVYLVSSSAVPYPGHFYTQLGDFDASKKSCTSVLWLEAGGRCPFHQKLMGWKWSEQPGPDL